jgi:hypothetical protein
MTPEQLQEFNRQQAAEKARGAGPSKLEPTSAATPPYPGEQGFAGTPGEAPVLIAPPGFTEAEIAELNRRIQAKKNLAAGPSATPPTVVQTPPLPGATGFQAGTPPAVSFGPGATPTPTGKIPPE